MFIPFYEAHTMRIAIAPQWMMKLSQVTAQIESIPLKKLRKTGKPYRRLKFEKGKRRFKGRLIGTCSQSPREHQFSFDHITKKDVLLTDSI